QFGSGHAGWRVFCRAAHTRQGSAARGGAGRLGDDRTDALRNPQAAEDSPVFFSTYWLQAPDWSESKSAGSLRVAFSEAGEGGALSCANTSSICFTAPSSEVAAILKLV